MSPLQTGPGPQPAAAAGPAAEADRQQWLLHALRRRGGEALPDSLVHAAGAAAGTDSHHGLAVYRANAAALAERALGADFPTVQLLLGAASFGAMARAYWHGCPPLRGDIAQWGASLPDWLAQDEQLACEPYLPDVARLEWAVCVAERAHDPRIQGQADLDLLRSADPAALLLQLAPGSTLLRSRHPVASLWHAHRGAGAAPDGGAVDPFDAVRAAFARGQGEQVLVHRVGWKAAVQAQGDDSAAFTGQLLQGGTLAQALDAAGPAFDFTRWLLAALQSGLLAGVSLAAR